MFRALPPSAISLQITDILAGIFGSFRGKKAIQNFKDEICRYFGVKYCFLASSGRGALSLLLSALHKNSPEKNEVAIPAYTSFSVPSAVVHAGLKVSLYDLDSKTMSPDEESLRKTITGNTLCIMACHLYGYVADMNVIISAARSSGTLI